MKPSVPKKFWTDIDRLVDFYASAGKTETTLHVTPEQAAAIRSKHPDGEPLKYRDHLVHARNTQ